MPSALRSDVESEGLDPPGDEDDWSAFAGDVPLSALGNLVALSSGAGVVSLPFVDGGALPFAGVSLVLPGAIASGPPR